MGELDLYLPIRPQIQSGDIILWKSSDIVSRAIRIFTEYSHASLVLDLNFYDDFKNRRFIIEAMKQGTVLNKLSRRLKNGSKEAWWMGVAPEYEQFRPAVILWAMDQLGTKYDFDSLFKNILGRVSADANKLFCSELCYMAWSEPTGMTFGMKKAPRPGDLYKMGIFKKPMRIK